MSTSGINLEEIAKTLSRSFAGLSLEMIIRAAILLGICLLVIKVILAVMDRAAERIKMEPALRRMIRGVVKVVLLLITIMIVLDQLGIPMTSLIALLSVAGLAISLSVQNFLSNVAGGIQILTSQPFKVGDYVSTATCEGTVREVGLFYTKLVTPDNKLVQLPNSNVVAADITNYSHEPTRRVDVAVSASYDTPLEAVKRALLDAASTVEDVLADPEPKVRVTRYGESAIDYVLWAWCEPTVYWQVYYGLMEAVKASFDREGVEMTYNHLNVHVIEQAEARH